MFDICPALHDGRISAERPGALTRRGYRRTPEVEEDWADAEDGAPFVFARGQGDETVTIAFWPYPRLCSVGFGGDDAASAVARVKTRIARERRLYRRVPEAAWTMEGIRHEAWRVERRVPMCLAIDTPDGEDAPLRYEVSYEPLPPLHPGMVRSACAPAAAP
ncbi:MAG TPA: hypothetical protein VEA60_08185 [Allosphingosinicella sp.]|nr:hypothetical protein [Allosphingosinicella sp.]